MSSREELAERAPEMAPLYSHQFKKYQQQKAIASMPNSFKSRVQALRKLQSNVANIEVEYHKKLYELELNMEKDYDELFSKRRRIINGEYEPTGDECDMPEIDYGDTTEIFEMTANQADGNKPGLPGFWLSVLKYIPLFDGMLNDTDEPALMHLTDIRFKSKPLPEPSFILEFYFSPNEYFSNSVLTKEYFLKYTPDDGKILQFDGPEIYYCRGCDIDWFEGKDLTKKSSNKGNGRSEKTESFFNFFDTYVTKEEMNLQPELMVNKNLIGILIFCCLFCLSLAYIPPITFGKWKEKLTTDFEIGQYMKERIIPRAVLYYTTETDDLSDTSSEDENSYDCMASDDETHDINDEADDLVSKACTSVSGKL